jgi:phage gpG-like protein
MARIRIDIEVRAEDVQQMVDDIMDRMTDMRPVFRWAQLQLRKSFAENFTSNGLEVGGWAPLSAEYASWKATRYPGVPPMVRSGKLFRSLAELSDPQVNEINKLSARFGTAVPYAEFHQMGTSKMPKREVVFIPRLFLNDMAEKMANYIVEGNEGLAS